MITTPFFSSPIEMTNLTMNEKPDLGSINFATYCSIPSIMAIA